MMQRHFYFLLHNSSPSLLLRGCTPSRRMVEELKAAGARAWSEGRFNEAIEQYTLAITQLTSSSSSNNDRDMLKTLYSNRSAAYMK
jgi:hypothetical protein